MALQVVAKEVILASQDDWHEWIRSIQASIPYDQWKYFDPEQNDEYLEPTPPRPLPRPTSETQDGPATRASSSTTVGRQGPTGTEIAQYNAERAEYREDSRKYERFRDLQNNVRSQIYTTIAPSRQAILDLSQPTREWLKTLAAGNKPPSTTLRAETRVSYNNFVNVAHQEWPKGGPEKWLSEWETLLSNVHKYVGKDSVDWRTELRLAWKGVEDLRTTCEELAKDSISETPLLSPAAAAGLIRTAWKDYLAYSKMRKHPRERTTRGAASSAELDLNDPPSPTHDAEADTPTSPTSPTSYMRNESLIPRKRARTTSE